jgi:SAM-dependent methyltransferase
MGTACSRPLGGGSGVPAEAGPLTADLDSPGMTGHDDMVRQEFSKQAVSFEDPTYSFADRRLIEWILTHVPARAGEVELDVAGGTGIVGRAFARTAAQAVVVDLTRAMLETGKAEADRAGVRNVLFVEGDAAALPFLDESFDLVTCRFAVHHFEDPVRQIAEMARVCRHGGRVAIVDLVAWDEELAPEHDRLERLRDPSHTRALPAHEIATLLGTAGVTVVHETVHDQRLALDRWLAQTAPPPEAAQEIRAELEAELGGGPATGMRPLMHDDALHFTQRWAILLGEKRDRPTPG